jgi:DNA-binding PadR family transcriptional regulator
VRRVPDPEDRRGTLVELTHQSRELIDRALISHVANEARLLQPLSREEQQTLASLLRKMKRRVGLMWSALPSQIYPELARLEKQALVTHQVVEQPDYRPDKKVYEITEAGRQALRQWVTQPTPPTAIRDEFVLKAYSIWLADPQEALPCLHEQEQAHSKQLAEHEELLARLEREWGSALHQLDSPLFGSSIAIRYGIDYEKNYVAWCQWVIAQLEQQMRAPASQAVREEESSSRSSSEPLS